MEKNRIEQEMMERNKKEFEDKFLQTKHYLKERKKELEKKLMVMKLKLTKKWKQPKNS